MRFYGSIKTKDDQTLAKCELRNVTDDIDNIHKITEANKTCKNTVNTGTSHHVLYRPEIKTLPSSPTPAP